MEPITTTALDDPQHDDILAAHRSPSDEFESDGDATMGDNSAGRFVSIDGSTDVEYYRRIRNTTAAVLALVCS